MQTMPEGATRVRGAPQGVGHALGPHGHSVRRLVPFFRRKKANIRIEIVLKISAQSELRISGNLRNGEREESESAETEANREREIQSRRGSRPSAAMEAIDPRGNPCPI